MEIDALVRKRLKLKRQFQVLRDIIMVLVAITFIISAFVLVANRENAIPNDFSNIRYGLFSFGLIVSGTALIIAVYMNTKKHVFKLIQHKQDKK
jgi:hypothetical protein